MLQDNTVPAGQDSWPIHVESIGCLPLCVAYKWTITDVAILARLVSRIAIGQATAVTRVLEALEVTLPAPPAESAITAALGRFTTPANDAIRYRRDGWLFQTIAWLATWQGRSPGDLIRTPQFRQGEHGIDGLLISVDSTNGRVGGVSICEQKATDNPRKKIYEQVWPEIEQYERGERDDQLVAEVAALLERKDASTAVSLASAIHWKHQRRYRVSVTVGETFDAKKYLSTFSGYDEKAGGSAERRHAETLALVDLRGWMDTLSEFICRELTALKGSNDV